jgi:predicted DNA-binding transcriptional regulator YafY
VISFRYCNHRGEVSERTVRPQFVWYGVTEWYSIPQWFLSALDPARSSERRDFALADMVEIRPEESSGEPEAWASMLVCMIVNRRMP